MSIDAVDGRAAGLEQRHGAKSPAMSIRDKLVTDSEKRIILVTKWSPSISKVILVAASGSLRVRPGSAVRQLETAGGRGHQSHPPARGSVPDSAVNRRLEWCHPQCSNLKVRASTCFQTPTQRFLLSAAINRCSVLRCRRQRATGVVI